jgi:prepilin-type N-terminal cleavage/methylation domain-containing protein
MSLSKDCGKRGFSLIELLAAIAIAGILISIAWVRMSTLVPIYRLEGSARNLAAEIQKARARAIAESKCYQVSITPGASPTYQLMNKASCSNGTFAAVEGAKHVDDNDSITLAFSTGSSPVFNSRGTVETTAVITLTNVAAAVRTVGVDANGRVYVQ